MFRLAALLFLIVVVAWAAGVRIHPHVLQDYLIFNDDEVEGKPYRKIDFRGNSSYVIGKWLEETEDSIVLRIPSGKVHFEKAKIKRITPFDRVYMKKRKYYMGVYKGGKPVSFHLP